MQIGDMTPSEIDDVLRTQTVARLACQEGGRPYIVPIAYAYEDGAVLVHSLEGTKVRMMRANPRVCFQVDAIERIDRWRSVVGWGEFEELRGADARAALDVLIARLLPGAAGGDPFAPPGMEDRVVLFRVRLRETSGRAARP